MVAENANKHGSKSGNIVRACPFCAYCVVGKKPHIDGHAYKKMSRTRKKVEKATGKIITEKKIQLPCQSYDSAKRLFPDDIEAREKYELEVLNNKGIVDISNRKMPFWHLVNGLAKAAKIPDDNVEMMYISHYFSKIPKTGRRFLPNNLREKILNAKQSQ